MRNQSKYYPKADFLFDLPLENERVLLYNYYVRGIYG